MMHLDRKVQGKNFHIVGSEYNMLIEKYNILKTLLGGVSGVSINVYFRETMEAFLKLISSYKLDDLKIEFDDIIIKFHEDNVHNITKYMKNLTYPNSRLDYVGTTNKNISLFYVRGPHRENKFKITLLRYDSDWAPNELENNMFINY